MRRNDDEGEIAEREAAKLVYGANSPYARQPELATIGAVTVADLQAWHDRTIGGKLIVSVSGDFDPAAMEAKLRATFEALPPAKPYAGAPRRLSRDPKPGVYFINKEDVNQSNIEIVGLGTERRNPDVPSLAMMNDDSWRRIRKPTVSEDPHRAGTGLCSWRRSRLRVGPSRLHSGS